MSDNDVYDFGNRLKSLRQKRKLKQTDVAEILDISRASVSGFENNTITPSFDNLMRLARLYNASLDYIVGFSDRNSVFIDDLPDNQQKLIMEMLEVLRKANTKNE